MIADLPSEIGHVCRISIQHLGLSSQTRHCIVLSAESAQQKIVLASGMQLMAAPAPEVHHYT